MRQLGIIRSEISWAILRALNILEQNQQGLGAARLKAPLKALLEDRPYWPKGHIIFAQISLASEDIAAAYAAAQAGILLSAQSPKLKRAGEIVLAQCYLRRGAPGKAREILEGIGDELSKSPDLVEDLAAANMALGDFQRAITTFKSIKTELLSAQAQAALNYCEQKVKAPEAGQVYPYPWPPGRS